MMRVNVNVLSAFPLPLVALVLQCSAHREQSKWTHATISGFGAKLTGPTGPDLSFTKRLMMSW